MNKIRLELTNKIIKIAEKVQLELEVTDNLELIIKSQNNQYVTFKTTDHENKEINKAIVINQIKGTMIKDDNFPSITTCISKASSAIIDINELYQALLKINNVLDTSFY